MRDVVIVDAARTGFGKYGGTLIKTEADELAAPLLLELVKRNNLEKGDIDLCVMGNVDGHSTAPNLGRLALLRAGFPFEVPGFTVEHQCGSALLAINTAYMQLALGMIDIALAGGAENLSNAPYWIENARQGFRLDEKGLKIHCEFMETARRVCGPALYKENVNMGITAENLAEKYNISRQEQDEFAYESHMKFSAAIERGRIKKEILPIEVKTRKGPTMFDTDEHVKPDTTIEELGKLRPAFKEGGTVTAGNSSGMNDGAAVVLMMTREKAKELGLKPIASIGKHISVGVDPAIMGIAPAFAIRKILQMAGTKLEDYGMFEVNEAFCAQTLAVYKELELTAKQREKFNPNGGAIAVGHPVGASGARLVQTLIYEMQEKGVQRGIATLCCGGGTGIATELILED
ncbi:thiolase family protein [Clostridiales bacterium BAD-6]|uniref:Acetyl-CoA acetyltransferase n=1 Tax=Sinanaerobacter chloroacetimidivorans TaxID=2818044 RepID=A0A8J7W000_9FIRM|nr:thiolase family protein [Sinanaerobacter chloroacetimidivorans]